VPQLQSPLCHRPLLVRLNPGKSSLMGKTPWRTIGKHLPIDEIAHRSFPLLEGRETFPLLNPHLLPTPVIPAPDPPSNSHAPLKPESTLILLLHWRSLAPLPPGYPYFPTLAPQPFMGLSKFLANRIHQMRSGKSYLAAHPSWFTRHAHPLGPRCRSSDKTFEHAILHCEARRRLKEGLLPTLESLDAASPRWSSD